VDKFLREASWSSLQVVNFFNVDCSTEVAVLFIAAHPTIRDLTICSAFAKDANWTHHPSILPCLEHLACTIKQAIAIFPSLASPALLQHVRLDGFEARR
jgi:hypothetical protein